MNTSTRNYALQDAPNVDPTRQLVVSLSQFSVFIADVIGSDQPRVILYSFMIVLRLINNLSLSPPFPRRRARRLTGRKVGFCGSRAITGCFHRTAVRRPPDGVWPAYDTYIQVGRITVNQYSQTSERERSETANLRQGESGLDPKSVSGFGLRIRITSKI